MASKEVVALCTLAALTFLPLGLNPNGAVVVRDLFPSGDRSAFAIRQLQWFQSNDLENYFSVMARLYMIFAGTTICLIIVSMPPVTNSPRASNFRVVVAFVWYATCMFFLRGCAVLFPNPENAGVGLWVAVAGVMLFTQMVIVSMDDTRSSTTFNPARHPRVHLPTMEAPDQSRYEAPMEEEIKAQRVVMEESVPVSASAQQQEGEEPVVARGRSSRRSTVSGKSSRSKSRGKSKGRSKSRGATKTPGRTRTRKRQFDE